MKTLFSIIVVALNPGEKLLETLKSVEMQTCEDYEIIIKDGGSKDSSLAELQEYILKNPEFGEHINLYETPDKSIYDGMNQAVQYAEGEYLCFLNCGDSFHDANVLDILKKAIVSAKQDCKKHKIFYGDVYDMLQDAVVTSNPKMNAFACYRNVPCHQACFYHTSLFEERGYKTEYKVRGDYEHFLWCYFEKDAQPRYVATVVADYEGGGFSETKENLKRSKKEHKEITAMYMSLGQRAWYKFLMIITLAPLRTWMSHSPVFSKLYNKLIKLIYRNK